MSNLIKAVRVAGEGDSRLIDNNNRIKERLEYAISNRNNPSASFKEQRLSGEDDWYDEDQGLEEGLSQDEAAALLNSDFNAKDSYEDEWNDEDDWGNDNDTATATKTSEFVSGINAKEVHLEPEVDYNVEAQKIIDDAYNKADEILKQAALEAEATKSQAYDEGYRQGFEQGGAELQAEKQKAQLEIQEMLDAANAEAERIISEVEPALVDTILQVFRQVTDVLSEDRKDVVLQLVNNVLHKVNISHDFIIRVSKEDYSFLSENKNRIYGAVLGEGSIEIVEDATMIKNQCIIETGNGMYDCSLDVQLENLISEIKLLSCVSNE